MKKTLMACVVGAALALPAWASDAHGNAHASHAKPAASKAHGKAHANKAKPAAAAAHADAHAAGHGAGEAAQIRGVVQLMLDSNRDYIKRHNPEFYARFANKQTPRATVISCSDSRVQTVGFHGDATNDLFMIRDIGNQIATAEGSVEYGVRHLHTPLLMIIGHAACGAVNAATGDYSKLEPAIVKELNTIQIPKGIKVTDGVLINVNNQVEAAIMKFSGEVESGKLAVIGAFYDFRDDLGQGVGKLVITNINGVTDPERIAALVKQGDYLKYAFQQRSPEWKAAPASAAAH